MHEPNDGLRGEAAAAAADPAGAATGEAAAIGTAAAAEGSEGDVERGRRGHRNDGAATRGAGAEAAALRKRVVEETKRPCFLERRERTDVVVPHQPSHRRFRHGAHPPIPLLLVRETGSRYHVPAPVDGRTEGGRIDRVREGCGGKVSNEEWEWRDWL